MTLNTTLCVYDTCSLQQARQWGGIAKKMPPQPQPLPYHLPSLLNVFESESGKKNSVHKIAIACFHEHQQLHAITDCIITPMCPPPPIHFW